MTDRSGLAPARLRRVTRISRISGIVGVAGIAGLLALCPGPVLRVVAGGMPTEGSGETKRSDEVRPSIGAEEERSSARDATGASDKTGDASWKPTIFYPRRGGVLMGKPGIERIDVQTPYGPLSVPVEEIVQIRFARRLEASQSRKIEDAIRQLGDSDFDRREEAMGTLRRIGQPAGRFLKAAAGSTDEEVKNRAQTLLAELAGGGQSDAAVEEGLEPLGDAQDDEVVTRRFTIRGHVLLDKFSVETRYGRLEVSSADLTGLVIDSAAGVAKQVDISGTSIVPDSWLDTKLTLRVGSRLVLRAAGQLNVPNYSLTSGPEGSTRYSGTGLSGFPVLALVGKIGKEGKPFLVGREHKAKVQKEGRLYLGVVPFRRYAATGTYKVKIQTSR